jgi:hypothetical protein
MRLASAQWRHERLKYREPEGRVLSIAASTDVALEPAAFVRAGLRTIDGRATSQCAKGGTAILWLRVSEASRLIWAF